eukprot:TRINITY_DN11900_c0_g1_i1.p1 TRINITY_DN11900_c0_g1~~TRINITY_DN11900_c0_g1_i1.p1  ORF type:complete len:154 (+),score=36.49 TRINITY_DN11900_c0_g1_i1:210-671(+)
MHQLRELDVWRCDGGYDSNMEMHKTLEEFSFSADWDQFKMNEQKFGYVSTYDFLDYTVSIPTFLSQEQKMKANQISLDIENEQTNNLHEAEEKGQDIQRSDDERFSNVSRPKSKYIFTINKKYKSFSKIVIPISDITNKNENISSTFKSKRRN